MGKTHDGFLKSSCQSVVYGVTEVLSINYFPLITIFYSNRYTVIPIFIAQTKQPYCNSGIRCFQEHFFMGYCDEKKINLMKAIILALLILFSISTSAQTCDEFIELIKSKNTGTTYTNYCIL